MSVPYFLDPVEPSRGPRWLNRWLPSKRLRTDPLQGLSVEGRYAPVSIANWKLIPSMARTLLAGRVFRPLSFTADRRLTIVVPYRDREQHLAQLVPALTAMLRQQGVAAADRRRRAGTGTAVQSRTAAQHRHAADRGRDRLLLPA